MKILDVPQSGSQAGTTSSRNRFGQYRRTRAVPVNPNTTPQTEMRGILSMCSATWRTLTDGQRSAWAAWAALHPTTDSLGQSVVLTGAMAYNKINCLLVMLGEAQVSSPPGEDLDIMPTTNFSLLNVEAATIAFAPTPVGTDLKLLFYISPAKSVGVTFCRDVRYVTAAAAAAATPFDAFDAITARYGAMILGTKLFLRTRLVNTVSGAIGPWSEQTSAVVEEA